MNKKQIKKIVEVAEGLLFNPEFYLLLSITGILLMFLFFGVLALIPIWKEIVFTTSIVFNLVIGYRWFKKWLNKEDEMEGI